MKNQIKTALLLAVAWSALLAAGCSEGPRYEADPTLRQELFFKCMAALPAGPQETKYNDLDEVVEECSTQAYYMAKRCVANCS